MKVYILRAAMACFILVMILSACTFAGTRPQGSRKDTLSSRDRDTTPGINLPKHDTNPQMGQDTARKHS